MRNDRGTASAWQSQSRTQPWPPRHRVHGRSRARSICLRSWECRGETALNNEALLNNWVSSMNEKCVSKEQQLSAE